MPKRILLQIDSGDQPSSFDSIVAIDAGVDHLLRYSNVQSTSIESLIHGAMFTRGGSDLASTAIFIGGNDVDDAEGLLKAAQSAFFGPIRVSIMLDANGCNTTASAAVVAAGRHAELSGAKAVVLGGTGPVGRRIAQLLASEGAAVTLTSRSIERATQVCNAIGKSTPNGSQAGSVQPASPRHSRDLVALLQDVEVVIASGAAGIELANAATMNGLESLKVAIDLNAVPPAGIGGIGITDKAKTLTHGVGYGAIGVGGLKMKTHRAAINQLFESNDQILDAAEIYRIAKSLR